MSNLNIALGTIKLPSKGFVYPIDNPLSSGEVEIKYMTAKEEDILTNTNYIDKGIVLDKLLESLTMKKINVSDLIPGDKNKLLIAARMLGYGNLYKFTYRGEEKEFDLSNLEDKDFDESVLVEKNKNEFKFITPKTENEITFKLLTGRDDEMVKREIEGLKKIDKNSSAEVSTRLKYMITSVNGLTDSKSIREFVDNNLIAIESKALRDYVKEIQPNVNMMIHLDDMDNEIELPITLSFFWPD